MRNTFIIFVGGLCIGCAIVQFLIGTLGGNLENLKIAALLFLVGAVAWKETP